LQRGGVVVQLDQRRKLAAKFSDQRAQSFHAIGG